MQQELGTHSEEDILEECQQVLGYQFRKPKLLRAALTHASGADHRLASNERLEFLGDAVLGVVVTDLIYKSFPDLPEGDLARLRASVVNTSALADLGRSIGLGEHIHLGKGEEATGGRDKDSL